MSVTYRSVYWNRQKTYYDATLAAVLIVGIAIYAVLAVLLNPNITVETIVIRSTSVSAFVLLHVILCIGPLARLDPRFLPLLYNRRHLGVAMFLLALIHALFAVIQFHALGDVFPLVSLFTAYQGGYGAIAHFPFEPFGLAALIVLFIMAATSHDFWLRNLGASFWKSLHILVYAAYGSLVVHVAFGFLQSEPHPAHAIALGIGIFAVLGLHLSAFLMETARDRSAARIAEDGFLPVATIAGLREGLGHAAFLRYDRIAIYRIHNRVYALSNACRHQAGPIGEGRLIAGLVTCPWHGWNYRVEDGVSPPPFHEVLPTYRVRVSDGSVYVHPDPNPLETVCTGASVGGGETRVAAPQS